MFDHSTLRTKSGSKQTSFATRPIRLTKKLKELIASDEFSEAGMARLIKEEAICSPRELSALPRLTEWLIEKMTAQGALSTEQAAQKRTVCRSIDFDALEESTSPLHELLMEKPFYRDADLPTRRSLRAKAVRFAKRHKLTEMQAVSLWEGDWDDRSSLRQRLLTKCALWLPLLFALTACVVLSVFLSRILDFWAIALVFPLFCPIWEGFSELTEGGLRRLLPSAPLPALQKDKAPPICAMLTASVEQNATVTLRALEILLAANRDAEGMFGLIITLHDAPSRHSSDDTRMLAPILRAFEALEKRTDRPLRLCVAERSYLPRAHCWCGIPSQDELLSACASMLSGEDARFYLTVGKKSCTQLPLSLYLAPADSALAPDGLRTLASSLFHPLCQADCVLPFLRTADAKQIGHAEALTKRQVTLQKLGGPIPYLGFGMIRLSALDRSAGRGSCDRLTCALSACALFVKSTPVMPSAGQSTEARLLLCLFPSLRRRVSAAGRLPLYLMLFCCPWKIALGGLLLSFADLFARILTSIRSGRHFATHTIPRALGAGKAMLGRLVFPVQQFLFQLPCIDRVPKKAQKTVFPLLSAGSGIATAALLPLPLSALGLVWAVSPLLQRPRTKPYKEIPSADKAKLLGLCRKNWTFFEQYVTPDMPLPPVSVEELPHPRPSAYTSPDAFAFYLIACLAACDLSFIDPFTLEKRVCRALDAWEKLPTYHGLPYARYRLESGDSCGQYGVDSASCGYFALCLAAVSAGLPEYAAQNSALTALSERMRKLLHKMDLSLLYNEKQKSFFETRLPNGDGKGRLDLLMSAARPVCIAALALGQIDPAAWKCLRRPATGRSIRRGMQSTYGTVEEYLLPALFLPSAEDSLIGRAQSYVCAPARPYGDRVPYGRSFAYTYMADGSLSDKPLPSGESRLALMQSDRPPSLYPPHALCLMLPFATTAVMRRIHMRRLNRFEALGMLGRFGFYEALDCTEGKGRLIPMWDSAHLGQSMAATVNCLTGNIFQGRLMHDPAFAALEPLLNEPPDRLEPALQASHAPSPYAQSERIRHTDEGIPSLFLLGDSEQGVLWADGRRLLPFYRGRAMTYHSSLHHLYEDGHFSGLLLFRDGRPLTAPAQLLCRDKGRLTFAYRAEDCSVLATLTSTDNSLFSISLSCDGIGQEITALFCYCPVPQNDAPFQLETLPIGDLLLLRRNDMAAAVTVEGLDKVFIRAEEAPLPLGEDGLTSLLCREGRFTEGTLLTPTCKLGGRLCRNGECRILLAFGDNRTEVLEKISRFRDEPIGHRLSHADPLPISSEDEPVATYACSIELKLLFEHLKLRPILPHPADGIRTDSSSAHLRRCLKESLRQLEALGFEKEDTPFYLPPSGDLPSDELLKACLRTTQNRPLSSPPLPARTRIALTERSITVKKGRDLPPVCRQYENQACSFFADSYTPSFRFEDSAHPISLTLTLPDPSAHSTQTECSLFFAAAEVSYDEHEVRYTGDGYSVTAYLSPKHPLLILDVRAPLAADIRLGLPAPSRQSEDSDFWHRGEDAVDFCSRMVNEGRTVFLLGSFRRSSDRLYYRIREEIDARLAARLPLCQIDSDADMLTWQGQPPYPTPLLVHTALASNSPECFPLLLFFRDNIAHDALLRLFDSENRRAQVIACLLWEQFTENRDALRQKLERSTPTGTVKESLYLSAARALESLYEADASADDRLLPYLVAAFADLAHRMGDLSGEALYRSRRFEVSEPLRTDKAKTLAETAEEIALLLLRGDRLGTAAWKGKIDALPLFPSPDQASTLWSLFWYGVLGYRETPRGFFLHPLLCDTFDGCTFTLRRRDTVYRVHIAFSAHASCLLDGKSAEMPFLFDKKAHFLEITVEKSP